MKKITFFLLILAPFFAVCQNNSDPVYYTLPDFGKAGAYSHAVEANDMLYISGTIPLDYTTGAPDTADIAKATTRVLNNLKTIAEYCGADFKNAVKVNVYMRNMGDFFKMNEVYKTFFSENYPIRTTVGVTALPLNVPIEMDMVISKNKK